MPDPLSDFSCRFGHFLLASACPPLFDRISDYAVPQNLDFSGEIGIFKLLCVYKLLDLFDGAFELICCPSRNHFAEFVEHISEFLQACICRV